MVGGLLRRLMFRVVVRLMRKEGVSGVEERLEEMEEELKEGIE